MGALSRLAFILFMLSAFEFVRNDYAYTPRWMDFVIMTVLAMFFVLTGVRDEHKIKNPS